MPTKQHESLNNYTCYYCGMGAETVDHVIPKSFLEAVEDLEYSSGNRVLLVRCCKECNSLLGSTVQDSLKERKLFLKKKLAKRYGEVLKTPPWMPEELDELEGKLRTYVLGQISLQKLIRARLLW